MLTTILAIALSLSPTSEPSPAVRHVEQPALRLPQPVWAFAEMPHQPDLDTELANVELTFVGVSPFKE